MIAEKIKCVREQNGLTQSELAKKLNITRSSVNAWEMGLSVPSTRYVVELAQLFKITTDYLLDVSSNIEVNINDLTEEEKEIVMRLLQYFQNNKMNLQ